jgi:tetratricopeptide (TPR) repeat protein
MRVILLPVLTLGLSLLVAAAAYSAGGGGGMGGGGGGSRSGPDPNKAYREGIEYLAAGNCKKAERKFRVVLKAVSRNAEVNYLRGTALGCMDKHKSAVKHFRRAIRYDKSMVLAYERLGLSYLALEKPEDANQQLARLAELRAQCAEECEPKLIRAHGDLEAAIRDRAGGARDSVGQTQGGAEHSLLFEGISEPRTRYFGAVQLINAGEFEAAIAALRQLAAKIGPVPDVLNYLGYAHRRLGRFDESLAYYQQALALDPMHRGANEYLGELFVELGKIDSAQQRLAVLDRACPFGCAEYEDLKQRIESRVVATR